MSTPYEIPLTAESQTFQITLAGVAYHLTVRWNPDLGSWVLDIADSSQVAILQGIPLVTGLDLLAQYAYLKFGGALLVQTDHAADVIPTFDNLGSTSHLYFVVG